MRRFWSEPLATRASRVPSGERIAEAPKSVYRLASAPISALRRIACRGCGGFGARSTKPMANAMAISASTPATAGQATRSRQPLVAGAACAAPAIFRCRQRILNLDPDVARICKTLTSCLSAGSVATEREWLHGSRSGQRRPIRFGLHHGGQNVGDVFAVKRLLPGQQFIQHAAERPNVRSLVHRFAPRLLRAHVRRRAQNHSVHRRRHAQRR